MKLMLTGALVATLAAATLQETIRVRVEGDPPEGDPTSEFARVFNDAPEPFVLTGYRLCDAAGACFTFPAGAAVQANDSITLITGRGTDAASVFYWQRGSAVWNNPGDVARLVTPEGEEIARYSYGSAPAVRPLAGSDPPPPPVVTSSPPRTCCRICRTGKACGDSCISRSNTCHRGPGCACNGGDDRAWLSHWLADSRERGALVTRALMAPLEPACSVSG